MSEGKFDSHRRLCPDGGCIGVIGTDGRCRVCGRVAGGGSAAPAPGGSAPVVEDEDKDEDNDENEDEHEDEDGAEDGGKEKAGAAGGGFDPKRRLCPDGDCLGVLGADGVCNVCGKKAD
jgi:hypothetical protein